MTLDTFFKKFDPFAAAPGAVAKMHHFSSPNGAKHASLGHRPRKNALYISQAPTGRPIR
jgi:hypothetical protein